jgi:hypothetical protein
LVDPLGPQSLGAALDAAQSLPLALPTRHFQAFLSSEPLHALDADLHPGRRNSAVAML